MKLRSTLLVSLFAIFGLTACNDDDPATANSGNANANKALTESLYTEAGYKTLATSAIYNLETPRLKGGNNAFVVHCITTYGVNYTMEYDLQLLASRWTAYEWYAGNSVTNWNRSKWDNGETFNGYGGHGDPFQPDPVIPEEYQTTLADHQSNGHDRGHMLASQDRVNSKDANGQTFYLSNMHPQLNGFNANGIWLNLESWLRSKNTNSFRDTLYVVKGGTIDNNNYTLSKGASGRNLVTPKYFYMAILCKRSSDTTQSGYKAIAFWMEHKANTDKTYANYAISIDQLEEKTGIDFFCNLPDDIENQVEGNLVLTAWGLSK